MPVIPSHGNIRKLLGVLALLPRGKACCHIMTVPFPAWHHQGLDPLRVELVPLQGSPATPFLVPLVLIPFQGSPQSPHMQLELVPLQGSPTPPVYIGGWSLLRAAPTVWFYCSGSWTLIRAATPSSFWWIFIFPNHDGTPPWPIFPHSARGTGAYPVCGEGEPAIFPEFF